jgi:CheY-like chemotaxis protein
MAELLLVEDDEDIAECLRSVLEDEGHVVRVAENGQDGLDRVTEAMPDAVLLDVEMPVLDGPGMAQRLFVRNCGHERIPIVLLSGVSDLDRIAERVGTPYFLTKPYRIEDLVGLLQLVLTERRGPIPLAAGKGV